MPSTYYKPDQNLSFLVPSINEAFVGTGYGLGSGSDETIYINTGNAYKGINLKALGEKITGKNASTTSASELIQAGLQYFTAQTGINPKTLKQYNLGDAATYAKDKGFAFEGANEFLTSSPNDINPFLNLKPMEGADFTVPIDPNLQSLFSTAKEKGLNLSQFDLSNFLSQNQQGGAGPPGMPSILGSSFGANQPSMATQSNYTIKSGDTLGAIAQANGMSLSQLLQLNPQFQSNPNLINPGQIVNLSPTPQGGSQNQAFSGLLGGGVGEGSGLPQGLLANLNLGNLGTIDSSLFQSGKSQFDVQSLINQIQQGQQAYIQSLQPSQKQLDLQTQLLDLKKKYDEFGQAQEAGIQKIEGQVIPQELLVGQQAALKKQGESEEKNLVLKQQNLLTELGLEQEAQKVKQMGAEKALDFMTSNFDIAIKMQDKINTQKQQAFENLLKLNAAQKSKVADILDVLKGVNPDNLSPQDSAQLANIASQIGITPQLLYQSLKVGYNQSLAEQLYQKAQTNKLLTESSGQGTELTPKQATFALQLSNSLKSQPAYTDMLDIYTGIQGVETGLSQSNGFGDITAINAFQRMVDPGATVRSEDVALLQSASSFIQKVLSDYPIEKLTKGSKLPDAVRQQMLKTAQELYERRAKNYNETVGQQYKNLTGSQGIPFEFVGQDFPTSSQFGSSFEDYANLDNQSFLDTLPTSSSSGIGQDSGFFQSLFDFFKAK